FRMDDDADSRMLRAQILDLPDGESCVNRAVSLPQDDPCALRLVGIEAAENFVRIPHDHVVERNAHLVCGVSTKMLAWEEQHAFDAFPRPLQRGGGIRRRAHDAATFTAECFD